MRKHILWILGTLILVAARTVYATEPTDITGTPTQDEVLSLSAVWLDDARTPYNMEVLESDQLTMDTVTSAFNFIYKEKNKPVRFFPPDTQQEIASLLGGVNPDALFITEMINMTAPKAEPKTDLEIEMLMDVNYVPDQLIIIVVGNASNPENLEWTPLKGSVIQKGLLKFVFPADLIARLQGNNFVFSLLTDRKVERGGIVTVETTTKAVVIPSKTISDTVQIIRAVAMNGDRSGKEFKLEIAEETPEISNELSKIRNFIDGQKQPVVEWFPENNQNEIQQLLGSAYDMKNLVIYDYIPLITKNFNTTEGDVISTFSFATPYTPGQKIVSVLGIPKEGEIPEEESLMEYAVQRAEVEAAGTVDIIFDQKMMFDMGEKTGLLMILSEPLEKSAQSVRKKGRLFK